MHGFKDPVNFNIYAFCFSLSVCFSFLFFYHFGVSQLLLHTCKCENKATEKKWTVQPLIVIVLKQNSLDDRLPLKILEAHAILF